MKKYLNICITVAVAIALNACGGNNIKQKLIGTDVITGTSSGTGQTATTTFAQAEEMAFANQLISAVMAAYGHRNGSVQNGRAVYSIAYSYPGSVSGSITVSGSLGGTYSNGIYDFDVSGSENFSNYSMIYNNLTYELSNVYYVGPSLFGTLITDGTTFQTSSSISLSGRYAATGNGFTSQIININLKFTLNSAGTGGTVTGTTDKYSINQAFTL